MTTGSFKFTLNSGSTLLKHTITLNYEYRSDEEHYYFYLISMVVGANSNNVASNKCTIKFGSTTMFAISAGRYTTGSSAKTISIGSSKTVSKTHASQTVKLVFTDTANPSTNTFTKNLTVPAKPSYAVKYAANGGSSTPSQQTKWYGEALTLAAAISRANGSAGTRTVKRLGNGGADLSALTSAGTVKYTFSKWKATDGQLYPAKEIYTANAATTMTAQWTSATTWASVALGTPSRSGYSFVRWNTAANNSGTGYAGGSSLTPSGDMTLYAIWSRTVSYNANGGTGAPASQTALATSAITLSSAKPTRAGCRFLGWATSQANADAGKAAYQPGGTYPAQNPSVTLYAVWQADAALAVARSRTDANGTADDLGGCLKVDVSWSGTADVTALSVTAVPSDSGKATLTWSDSGALGDSGTRAAIMPGAHPGCSYAVTVAASNGLASCKAATASATAPATAYRAPVITGVTALRAESAGGGLRAADDGTLMILRVGWKVYETPSQMAPRGLTVTVVDEEATDVVVLAADVTALADAASGSLSLPFDGVELSAERRYHVTVALTDAVCTVRRGDVLSRAYFTMDVLGDAHRYTESADNAVDSSKTYWAASGEGRDVSYSKAEPDGTENPHALGWLEKTGPRPGHGVSFGAPAVEEGFNVSMPQTAYGHQVVPCHVFASYAAMAAGLTGDMMPCLALDASDMGLYWVTESGAVRVPQKLWVDEKPGVAWVDGANHVNAALYVPKTEGVNSMQPALVMDDRNGGSWVLAAYGDALQAVYLNKANKASSTNSASRTWSFPFNGDSSSFLRQDGAWVTPGTMFSVNSPVPVGNGGTGLTASPSLLVNLGSTSAANVLQASPRPGVTGTLPIAHGGTSMTGLESTTSITRQSGAATISLNARRWGKVCSVYIVYTTAANISVSANGNITDLTIGTMPSGWRPAVAKALVSTANAGLGYVNPSGSVVVTALAPSGSARTCEKGSTGYLTGTYLLA